jgi:hypothetical protein
METTNAKSECCRHEKQLFVRQTSCKEEIYLRKNLTLIAAKSHFFLRPSKHVPALPMLDYRRICIHSAAAAWKGPNCCHTNIELQKRNAMDA